MGVVSDKDSMLCRELVKLFGTMEQALQSLFMSISGGVDWGEVMSPLEDVGWIYGKIFIFYIFFMIFGVLNVVIASFVDSASQISTRDRELVIRDGVAKASRYAQKI